MPRLSRGWPPTLALPVRFKLDGMNAGVIVGKPMSFSVGRIAAGLSLDDVCREFRVSLAAVRIGRTARRDRRSAIERL